jgi:hypothetical protein
MMASTYAPPSPPSMEEDVQQEGLVYSDGTGLATYASMDSGYGSSRGEQGSAMGGAM